MVTDKKNNYMEVIGTIVGDAQFVYEIKGIKMYRTQINTARLSGVIDEVPLVMSEYTLENIKDGCRVKITGSMRTHSKLLENGKSKCDIYCYVDTVTEVAEEDKDMCCVEIIATVCKEPKLRETPLHRVICEIMSAVNTTKYRSSYIPTLCWSENAKKANTYTVGTRIVAKGRFQSRPYKKSEDEESVTHIAYEFSVHNICTEEEYKGNNNKFREDIDREKWYNKRYENYNENYNDVDNTEVKEEGNAE